MSENLPAVAGDLNSNVLVAAVAKAAAMLAAQNVGDRAKEGSYLDHKAIEAIAEDCVREAFQRIGVDLKDHKSVQAFNTTLAHAEGARTMMGKIGAAVLTAVLTSIALGIVALVGKYGFGGMR